MPVIADDTELDSLMFWISYKAASNGPVTEQDVS